MKNNTLTVVSILLAGPMVVLLALLGHLIFITDQFWLCGVYVLLMFPAARLMVLWLQSKPTSQFYLLMEDLDSTTRSSLASADVYVRTLKEAQDWVDEAPEHVRRSYRAISERPVKKPAFNIRDWWAR